jgi:hypothetical protein
VCKPAPTTEQKWRFHQVTKSGVSLVDPPVIYECLNPMRRSMDCVGNRKMSIYNKLVGIVLLGIVYAEISAFHIDGRDAYPCPTSCGGGWCCDVGQVCRAGTSDTNPFVCADSMITGADGY